VRQVSALAPFRIPLRVAFGVLLLGFVLMFVSPPFGAWVALPGMLVVVGCGLLAFGLQLLAMFPKWRSHG